jgi:membrane protein YdbS with pleckstrin-like domain
VVQKSLIDIVATTAIVTGARGIEPTNLRNENQSLKKRREKMRLFEKIVRTIIVAVCMLFGLTLIGLVIALIKALLIALPAIFTVAAVIGLILVPVGIISWNYVNEQDE